MRKKFTMLLASLLCCVGVMKAQGVDPTALPQMSTDGDVKWYTIKNTRSGMYANYAGDGTNMTQVDAPLLSSLFYFTASAAETAEGFTPVMIHNAATEKVLEGFASWTDEGKAWYLCVDAQNATPAGLHITNTAKFEGWTAFNDGGSSTITNYLAKDGGSVFVLEEVVDLVSVVKGVKDEAKAELENLSAISSLFPDATKAISDVDAVAPKSNDFNGLKEAIEAVEAIVANYKSAVNGKSVKLTNCAGDARGGRLLGYDKGNSRAAAVLLDTDATVWTFESCEDGTFKLYNLVNDLYLGAPESAAVHKNKAEAPSFNLISTASNKGALVCKNGQMVHISNADGANFKVMSYYSLTDAASLWMIDACTIQLDRDEYNAYIEAKSTIQTGLLRYAKQLQDEYGLVKSGDKVQVVVNHPDGGDSQPSSNLLDGNNGSYVHSAYSGEDNTTNHYIEVELSAATQNIFCYFSKRNNNNRPTVVEVHAGNSADALTKVATLHMAESTDNNVQSYFSKGIDLGAAYTHLRFVVTATNTGTKFFTLSEFYVLPINAVTKDIAALAGASICDTDLDARLAAAEISLKNLQLPETLAEVKAALDANANKHAANPALGQYTTEAYNKLKAAYEACTSIDQLDAVFAAFDEFKKAKNLPVFTIGNGNVKGYTNGKSIYDNNSGTLYFKTTNVGDKTMWWALDQTTTTVGVTEEVGIYNVGTGNGFWGASSIKITETNENGGAGIADDGIFLFYTTGNNYPIHFQETNSEIVRYGSYEANSGSAAVFTYIGNTYNLSQLTDEKLAAISALQDLYDSKNFYNNAIMGTAIGEYTGDKAPMVAALQSLNDLLSANLNLLAVKTVDELKSVGKAVEDAEKKLTKNLPVAGRYYRIRSALAGFEVVKAVYGDFDENEAPIVRWKTFDEGSMEFYWKAVETATGGIALQNVKNGKYLLGNETKSGVWSMADTSTGAEIDVTILGKNQTTSKYEYGVIITGWQMHALNHQSGAGTDGGIVSYPGEANSPSAWYLEELELPSFFNVSYNFIYNGEVKHSATKQVGADADYPDPALYWEKLPYGVKIVGDKPAGKVVSNDVRNIELGMNLPFEVADSYNEISTWYYAKMHSNTPKFIEYLADAAYIEWADARVNRESRDTYSWALVGNVFDGFKLVNKAAGAEKALVSTGEGNPAMGAYADGTLLKLAFSNITPKNGEEYFSLQCPGEAVQYLNAQSGKLAHWTAADAGSTIEFVVAGLASDLAALVAEVEKAEYLSYGNDSVGYYTKASTDALKAACEKAKEANATENDLVALLGAVEGLEVVYPEAGKYYQVVSTYTFADTMAIYNKGNAPAWKKLNKNDVSFIWTITPNADNTAYTFKNMADGRYLKGVTMAEEAAATQLNWLAVGKFNVVSDGKVFHAGNHGNGAGTNGDIINNEASAGAANNASSWKIVEIDEQSKQALQAKAADAKKSALALITAAEEADYYTYADEAIAKAKAAVQSADVETSFTAAMAAWAAIEKVMAELAATEKNDAPAVGDFIRLKNKQYGQYLKAGESDMTLSADANLTTLWEVVAGDENGNIKLKSASTNKYIGEIRKSEVVSMVGSNDAKMFAWTNQADVYAVFKETTGGDHAYGHVRNDDKKLVGWEPSADATQWVLQSVEPMEITYIYGDDVYDAKVPVDLGAPYKVASPYAFTKVVACMVDGEELEADAKGDFSFEVTDVAVSVIVTLEDDLPFVTTTIENGKFADDTEWYAVKQHYGFERIWQVGDDSETVTAVDASNLDLYNDKQLWCFVGNAVDGIQIYNKAVGAGKSLKDTDDAASLAEGATSWNLATTGVTTTWTNPFCLKSATYGKYLNRQGDEGSNLKYYGSNDNGSTMTAVSFTSMVNDLVAKWNGWLAVDKDVVGSLVSTEGLPALIQAYQNAPTQAAEDAVNKYFNDAPKKEIAAGKYYQIVSTLQSFKETKALYATADSLPAWKTFNADDKSFFWTITPKTDSTFTFKSVLNDCYLNGVTLVEKDTVDTKLTWLTIGELNIVSNGQVLHAYGHGGGDGVEGNIIGHLAGANSASSWKIVEVEPAIFYDITYDYKYNGVTKETKTYSIKLGGAYPDFEYKTPWGIKIADSKPEGTVSESKVFVVNLIDDALPFEYAADYASIEDWYYLKFHATEKNYLYYDATLEYLDATKTAIDRTAKDAYTWAFVGNPYDGFRVVNKLAGDKMVLSSAVEPTKNAEYPKMVTADTITMGNKTWDVTKSSYGTDGFFMAYPETNWRLNKQSGKVAYWSGADAGSTFMVEVCGPAAELASLVAEAKNVNLKDAGKFGCYTEEYADALTEAIEKAEALETVTDADVLALATALEAVEIKYPEVGKFYRFKNAKSNNYMSGNKENITLLADGAEAVSTIFYVGEGNTLLSYNAGLYLDCQAKAYAAVGTAREGEFNIAYGGMKAGVITYKNNNYWTFGDRAEGQGLDRGSAAPNQEGYNWVVEEVAWLPVAINTDYGYATLTSPVALSTYEYASTTSHRVNAYTGTLDGDALVLKRVDGEDGIIPANTPVVIEYVAGVKDGYVFLEIVESEKDAIESDLVGTTAAEAKGTKNAYTLQGNAEKNGAVFKKYTGTNLVGFKAYLDIETEAAAISIRKDEGDGTTGIEDANIQAIDAIYDLTGRRVEKMDKGIYIVNGRKVIVQ